MHAGIQDGALLTDGGRGEGGRGGGLGGGEGRGSGPQWSGAATKRVTPVRPLVPRAPNDMSYPMIRTVPPPAIVCRAYANG